MTALNYSRFDNIGSDDDDDDDDLGPVGRGGNWSNATVTWENNLDVAKLQVWLPPDCALTQQECVVLFHEQHTILHLLGATPQPSDPQDLRLPHPPVVPSKCSWSLLTPEETTQVRARVGSLIYLTLTRIDPSASATSGAGSEAQGDAPSRRTRERCACARRRSQVLVRTRARVRARLKPVS